MPPHHPAHPYPSHHASRYPPPHYAHGPPPHGSPHGPPRHPHHYPPPHYSPQHPSAQHNVAALVERFVDNRRRRQQSIDAHLDEVVDSLTQGDPVKFAFWSLDQDAAFFEGEGPAPRMLEVLGREIGLTAEQMGQLSTHRAAIREDRNTITRCHQMLREAREAIHRHIHRSGAIMEQIRCILTPVQVAKFFVWVERHQNSVKTLTTLWDRPDREGGGGGGAGGGRGGGVGDDEEEDEDEGDGGVSAEGDETADESSNSAKRDAPTGDGYAPSRSIPSGSSDGDDGAADGAADSGEQGGEQGGGAADGDEGSSGSSRRGVTTNSIGSAGGTEECSSSNSRRGNGRRGGGAVKANASRSRAARRATSRLSGATEGQQLQQPSARSRRAAAAVSSARGTKGAIHEDDDAEVSLSSTAMGIAEQLADAMAAEDAAEDARSAAAAAAPPPIYDSGRVRRSVATWE